MLHPLLRKALAMSSDASTARLTATPPQPSTGKAQLAASPSGVQHLGIRSGRRDGVLFVPSSYTPATPTPLILALHGAGANGADGISHLLGLAEQRGVILLGPDSNGSTWDVLRGGWGPDVQYIDAALRQVFSKYNVDPNSLCASGFSDGASYALSLGLTNGDLFSHVLDFSPGFMRPMAYRGKPLVFISHGEHDRVLSIDYCSRRIAPQLRNRGYQLVYKEFNGGHNVPASIASEGMEWFLSSRVDMSGARLSSEA